MPTLTAQVLYVNPPKNGGKRGTIKLADGQSFGVFQEKLGLFSPGKTYEIEYGETESNGTTYKNVRGAKEIGGNSRQPENSTTVENPKNTYREICAKDAERMFVC